MRCLWVLFAAMVCLLPAPAHAERAFNRVTIDRVTLEPSPVHGLARMRVFVSALALEKSGDILPIPATAWKLRVGSSEKKIPYALGNYAAADSDTAIVLVVEVSADYAEVLETIKRVVPQGLISHLSTETYVGVVGFGASQQDTGKLTPVKSAAARLDKLSAESDSSEPGLADAVERALKVLQRVPTNLRGLPMRKMVVVLSGGRDRDEDRERITGIAKKAARLGIRIHTIGHVLPFEKGGSRGSLLTLGELSKQSLGTFRWVRTLNDSSWAPQIERLVKEIQGQYVLTYLVPAEDLQYKQISVTAELGGRTLTSNKSKVPRPLCGPDECPANGYCVSNKCVSRRGHGGLGVLGWILTIAGSLVGLVVLGAGAAAVAGVVKHRRAGGVPPKPPDPRVAVAPPGPGVGVPPAGVAPRPAAAQPVLLVLSGPRQGQRIPLHNGFVIGKAPGCHLVLDQDGFASSQHAMITMDTGGNCRLVDRGSTNGTFSNGIRITEVALTHGMGLRIGSTEMRFLTQ